MCRAQLTFDDGHKIFVVAKNQIGFGRAKRSKEPEIDFVMRALPVRSCELDPENWQKSSRLSGCHGYFAYRNNTLYIKDNYSKNGIFKVPDAIVSDLCSGLTDMDATESEDDSVPLLSQKADSLKPFKKGDWSFLPDHCTISLCKTGVLLLKTTVLRKSGKITAFRIERLSNWPQHLYIQLISKVIIGNSETSAIMLQDPAVTGEVAELTWEDVAFYLKRLSDNTSVTINSRQLELDTKVMLHEGCHIRIGDTEFIYTTATDDDFVNV